MMVSKKPQESHFIPTEVLVEPWPKLKPKPLVSAAVIFAIMGIVLGGILVYFLAPPDLGNNRSPSANVILYDGFSDPSSGWLEQKPEIGEVAEYTDDERYRIYGPPPDSYSVKLAPTGELGDVIVEVDATRIRDVPDEGISYWGIVCRAQDDDDDGEVDGGDYYLMIVGDNGNYGISKVIAGNEVKPSLASGDYNAAIYTEIEQTNWIRAECMGSKLALYVNGQRIAAVEDTEGPQFKTGKVGLLAGHESIDSPGSIDVLFDNFLARMP